MPSVESIWWTARGKLLLQNSMTCFQNNVDLIKLASESISIIKLHHWIGPNSEQPARSWDMYANKVVYSHTVEHAIVVMVSLNAGCWFPDSQNQNTVWESTLPSREN